MKKPIKIALISLAVLGALIFGGQIYFNYWLQNHLPEYLRDKTPFVIQYKDLQVGLWNGDITATQVSIYNKDPKDSKIKIKGTVAEAKVSRLGLFGIITGGDVSAKRLSITNPNLEIILPDPKRPKDPNKKESKIPSFRDFVVTDGTIKIYKYSGAPFISAEQLNVEIDKLQFNNDAEDKLPLTFDSYKINARNFLLQPDEVYRFTSPHVYTNDAKTKFEQFKMEPLISFQEFQSRFPTKRSLFNVRTDLLEFSELVLSDKKLNLGDIHLNKPLIQIFSNDNAIKPKEKSFSNELSLTKLRITDGSVQYETSKNQKFSLNQLNIDADELKIDKETAQGGLPFSYKDFDVKFKNFSMPSGRFYVLEASSGHAKPSSLEVLNYAFRPTLSREAHAKAISVEEDYYDITGQKLNATGIDWKVTNNQPDITIDNLILSAVTAKIYRDKNPTDAPETRKKLYSESLRGIKFPLWVKTLNLNNSFVSYAEQAPGTDAPGVLDLHQINATIKNVNSAKKKDAPTKVEILGKFMLYNSAPAQLSWSFDVANTSDAFNIGATITGLPAEKIERFVKNYANIGLSGVINLIKFNFNGTNSYIGGSYQMQHQNLKVEINNKKTGEQNGLLSKAANIILKNDTKGGPEVVQVNVKRENNAFFNFLWKGIEQGLKKVLIGENYQDLEQHAENIQSAVKDTKEAVKNIKTDFKSAVKDVKKEAKSVKETIKGIFKKKD